MPAPIFDLATRVNLLNANPGDYKKAFQAIQGTIYGALRDAATDVGKQLQSRARALIATAGLTGKWVTGFRVYIFPRVPNPVADIAIRGFHSYNIANVFERGAKVSGSPLLWIPLPSAPKRVKGKATTAARLIAAGVRLRRISGRGQPILIGYVLRSGTRARRKRIVGVPGLGTTLVAGQVTLQQLLNGQQRVVRRAIRSARGLSDLKSAVPVPLFIGIPNVVIKKRLNISALYDTASSDLAKFYAERLGGTGIR